MKQYLPSGRPVPYARRFSNPTDLPIISPTMNALLQIPWMTQQSRMTVMQSCSLPPPPQPSTISQPTLQPLLMPLSQCQTAVRQMLVNCRFIENMRVGGYRGASRWITRVEGGRMAAISGCSVKWLERILCWMVLPWGVHKQSSYRKIFECRCGPTVSFSLCNLHFAR